MADLNVVGTRAGLPNQQPVIMHPYYMPLKRKDPLAGASVPLVPKPHYGLNLAVIKYVPFQSQMSWMALAFVLWCQQDT